MDSPSQCSGVDVDTGVSVMLHRESFVAVRIIGLCMHVALRQNVFGVSVTQRYRSCMEVNTATVTSRSCEACLTSVVLAHGLTSPVRRLKRSSLTCNLAWKRTCRDGRRRVWGWSRVTLCAYHIELCVCMSVRMFTCTSISVLEVVCGSARLPRLPLFAPHRRRLVLDSALQRLSSSTLVKGTKQNSVETPASSCEGGV